MQASAGAQDVPIPESVGLHRGGLCPGDIMGGLLQCTLVETSEMFPKCELSAKHHYCLLYSMFL